MPTHVGGKHDFLQEFVAETGLAAVLDAAEFQQVAMMASAILADEYYKKKALQILRKLEDDRTVVLQASAQMKHTLSTRYAASGAHRECNQWTFHPDDKQRPYDYNRFYREVTFMNASLTNEYAGRKVYVDMLSPWNEKLAFIYLCAARDSKHQIEIQFARPGEGNSSLPLYIPRKPGDVVTLRGRFGRYTEHVIALCDITEDRGFVTYNVGFWSTWNDTQTTAGGNTAEEHRDRQTKELEGFTIEYGDGTAADFEGFMKEVEAGPRVVRSVLNAIVCEWDFDKALKGVVSGDTPDPELLIKVAQEIDSLRVPLNVDLYSKDVPVVLRGPVGTRVAGIYRSFISIVRHLKILTPFEGLPLERVATEFNKLPAEFANNIILRELTHVGDCRGNASLLDDEVMLVCRLIRTVACWTTEHCEELMSETDD